MKSNQFNPYPYRTEDETDKQTENRTK